MSIFKRLATAGALSLALWTIAYASSIISYAGGGIPAVIDAGLSPTAFDVRSIPNHGPGVHGYTNADLQGFYAPCQTPPAGVTGSGVFINGDKRDCGIWFKEPYGSSHVIVITNPDFIEGGVNYTTEAR